MEIDMKREIRLVAEAKDAHRHVLCYRHNDKVIFFNKPNEFSDYKWMATCSWKEFLDRKELWSRQYGNTGRFFFD